MKTKNKTKYSLVLLTVLFFFLIQITVVQSQSSGIGCCCVQSDPRTPPLSEPLQAGGSCNQEARFRDQTFCTQTCGGTLYDVADLANWGFDLTPPTNCHEICGSTTPPPPPVIIPPGSGECNNPPSNVIAFAGQGRQKITLQWDYPDGCNVQYYEITKTCTTPEHPDCTGGTPQSFTKSFIDSDVLWDQEYSYTIQPRGGTGSPPASSPLRVKVGNIECWGKISATPFCVNNWFYFKFFSTQYQEYMRTKEVWHPVREEWVGYSSGPETTFIEDTYTSRINGAWSCDPSSNSIVPAAPLCSAGVCVVRDGTPTCAQETACEEASADPFGLRYTAQSCEQDKYCVLDRSSTIANQCYNCHPSMECYDYKTRDACERNNCGAGNCAWSDVPGFEALGIGVCKNLDTINCQYCNSEGSQLARTRAGFNFIFDQCSAERAQALSTPQQTCFYNPATGDAFGCDTATCLEFTTPETCIGSSDPARYGTTPQQNAQHTISSPSINQCSIPVCSWVSSRGICVKNANRFIDETVRGGSSGANINDCDGFADEHACAADYFPPTSSIVVVDNDEGRNLQLLILDKQSRIGDELSRSGENYTLYYCFTQNPSGCDPQEYATPLPSQQYVGKTTYTLLRLTDGYVLSWDGDSFEQAFPEQLAAGTWKIFFYAEDPHKNVEVIKSQNVEVCHDCTPPTLIDFEVEQGREQESVWVAEDLTPTIRLTFAPQNTVLDEVVIRNKNNPVQEFRPTPQQAIGTPKVYTVTPTLTEGEYLVEVTRARTVPAQRYMPPVNYTVFVNVQAPELTSVSINGEDLISTPSLENPLFLSIIFSEPVQVQTVNYRAVGSAEIYDITSSLEQISPTTFESDLPELPAELYELQVAAIDLFGRQLADQYGGLRRFSMAGAHTIVFEFPEFGASSERIFDAIFNTVHEDAQQCVYKIWLLGTHGLIEGYDEEDAAQEFDVLPLLQRTGARTWSGRIDLTNASKQQPYDVSVICDYGAEDYHVEHFEVMFDDTIPEITLVPEPAIISDPRLRGNIRVNTNTPVICKYDTQDVSFAQMGSWMGARTPRFPFLLQQIMVQPGLAEQTFYVECEGAAQPARLHDRDDVTFEVNLALPLQIQEQLPEGISQLPFDFIIGTTQSANCVWSVNTYPPSTPFGAAGFTHSARVTSLGLGANTFYFRCQPTFGITTVDHEKQILYDNTPPQVSNVSDRSELSAPENERFTALTNALRIGWNAREDQAPLSIVSGGTYRLEETGGIVIINNVSVAYQGTGEQFIVTQDHQGNPLSLQDGKTYKFIVTARNQLGLNSATSQSDGVTVDVTRRPEQCAPYQCGGVCGPCVEGSVRCGDGTFGFGEECEAQGSTGFIFRPRGPQRCADFEGFTSGTLGCNLQTCQYNLSACTVSSAQPAGARCSDSDANTLGEECDITDMRGLTCSTLGYSGGIIRCGSTCQFDYSGCQGTVLCGNNIREGLELCDGTDLRIPGDGQLTCSNFDSFTSGILGACSASCDEVNTVRCARCGDNVRSGIEICDGTALPFSSCSSFFGLLGISGATGTLRCQSSCGGLDISQCQVCGNNRLESTEQCDTTQFGTGGRTCSAWNPAYTSGTLQCNGACQIVGDFCAGCGDGRISGSEVCDVSSSPSFRQGTPIQCDGYGLGSGSISCGSCSLDFSSCSQTLSCNNNGVKDVGEVCDSSDFGSVSKQCSAYGFLSGDVSCTQSCTVDFAACATAPPQSVCNNNNVKEGFEECDGTDLAGKSCSSFGLSGTGLRCSSCNFDTGTCTARAAAAVGNGTCGNSQVEGTEFCDGTTFLGGRSPSCTELGFSGSASVSCNSQCQYNSSVCQSLQNTSAVCGNGIVSSGEDCEGTELGGKTCTSLGFPGGTLSCKPNCKYNISQCTPLPIAVCGDGTRDLHRFELCDRTDFKGLQCAGLGPFTGGTLGCTAQCSLNTSSCQGSTTGNCGNQVINTGETCEGTNLGNESCSSLGFTSGSLRCSASCQYDVSNCAVSGSACSSDLDCVSGSCVSGFCASRGGVGACSDGRKNGDETGIDCGGSCVQKCVEGQLCVGNSDCVSGLCQFGICASACEGTDLGCGGLCPQRCARNQQCVSDTDCMTGLFCNEEGKCSGTLDDAAVCRGGNICAQGCPAPGDPDCAGTTESCEQDNVCNAANCEQDPDCSVEILACVATGLCTCEAHDRCVEGCTTLDPDCVAGTCSQGDGCGGGTCNPYDMDCTAQAEGDGLCLLHARDDPDCKITGTSSGVDTDGDGIPDTEEVRLGLDPQNPQDALEDPDEDGLMNIEEWKYGTNLFAADTDNDGWNDKEEIDAGTDPLDPNSYPNSSWFMFFILVLILLIIGIGTYYGWQYYQQRQMPKVKQEKRWEPQKKEVTPKKEEVIIPQKKPVFEQLRSFAPPKEKSEDKEWATLDNLQRKKDEKKSEPSGPFKRLEELKKEKKKEETGKREKLPEKKSSEDTFKALEKLKEKEKPDTFKQLPKPKRKIVLKPQADAFKKLQSMKKKR